MVGESRGGSGEDESEITRRRQGKRFLEEEIGLVRVRVLGVGVRVTGGGCCKIEESFAGLNGGRDGEEREKEERENRVKYFGNFYFFPKTSSEVEATYFSIYPRNDSGLSINDIKHLLLDIERERKRRDNPESKMWPLFLMQFSPSEAFALV
ncbi:unnamed protein product [Fraxinus pennsylvanica]|uniref:Uncharacterized protein n=1 Tax=Fraxinus pennsylvanica TaxID=56036 RepID=A0AAD1ZM66_9LAMI|nr:unnamed protein product [Fraxinus pennsylvanica]